MKNELNRKKIEFSPSETYHILTLKIRAQLLKESLAAPNLIKPLVDEINFFYSRRKERKIYSCCLAGCPFKTNDHKKYMRHLRALHSTTKHKIICKLKGCQLEFVGLNLLEIHVKTAHRARASLVKLNQNQLVEQLVQLRCLSASCNHQNVNNIKDLKRHLNSHFDKRETVSCIFSNCHFETDVSATLRSHCSKKHKVQDVGSLKAEIIVQSLTDFHENLIVPDDICSMDDEILYDGTENDTEAEAEEQEAAYEDEDHLDIFMKAVAITFNDWMNMKNIPYSTCNLIIQEVFNSYAEGKISSEQKIRKLLQNEQMDEGRIEEILIDIAKDEPFFTS